MKTSLKVILSSIGLFFFLLMVGSCSVISVYNDCGQQEAGIEAQYKQNQNNYANYFNKIKEMSSVPDMATSKLKEMYDSVMKGRYGTDGSRAMFQFIQEQNPNFNMGMYEKLMQTIESGRNSFEADQKSLLDKKRVYEGELVTFPNNIIAGFFGFPKKDLKNMDIVINDETAEAFSTKRAQPIKLN